MGACQGKRESNNNKLRKINKPQIPQSITLVDQQFQALIADNISRYLWESQPEYETLIEELVQNLKIRKYYDMYMQFRTYNKFLKQAEQLYQLSLQFALNEPRWEEKDRKCGEYCLVIFVDLYHIEKYKIIFLKQTMWFGRHYFHHILQGLETDCPEGEELKTIINTLIEYIKVRNVEIKAPPEERKVDENKLKHQTDQYLKLLYQETINSMIDSDSAYQDEVLIKQQKYSLRKRLL